MYPSMLTTLTSLSSRSSYATFAAAADEDDEYTLADILDILGPILGGLPTGLAETHHARKGHNFLTPTSFYLLVYITMLIALVYKLTIRQTGSWRQLSLPFAFSLARCAYWGLRFARVGKAVHPAKDLDQLTQRDFSLGFWFEQAALLLPCGILIFSSMMLFGDAMVGYQPRTAVARWMLKHWGSKGRLLQILSISLALPIPALASAAVGKLSEESAEWAHWLTFSHAGLHVVVLVIHLAALIVGWCADPPHARINPHLPFQAVDSIGKEKAKLFALTLLTGTVGISIVFRISNLLFTHHFHWMEDSGAFYSLFCLPEVLSVCLYLILPFKILIPDPRTLLRIDIPSLADTETGPEVVQRRSSNVGETAHAGGSPPRARRNQTTVNAGEGDPTHDQHETVTLMTGDQFAAGHHE